MTAERSIGYIGIIILFVNIFPFSSGFVTFIDIFAGIGLILIGSYMGWKRRVRSMGTSMYGHIKIPDIVEQIHRLQPEHSSHTTSITPITEVMPVPTHKPNIRKSKVVPTDIESIDVQPEISINNHNLPNQDISTKYNVSNIETEGEQ